LLLAVGCLCNFAYYALFFRPLYKYRLSGNKSYLVSASLLFIIHVVVGLALAAAHIMWPEGLLR